jgi:hypothetical protein
VPRCFVIVPTQATPSARPHPPLKMGPRRITQWRVAGRIEVGLARHGGFEADTTGRTWQRIPSTIGVSVPARIQERHLARELGRGWRGQVRDCGAPPPKSKFLLLLVAALAGRYRVRLASPGPVLPLLRYRARGIGVAWPLPTATSPVRRRSMRVSQRLFAHFAEISGLDPPAASE